MSHLKLTYLNYAHPKVINGLLEKCKNDGTFVNLLAAIFGVKRVITDWETVYVFAFFRGRYYCVSKEICRQKDPAHVKR